MIVPKLLGTRGVERMHERAWTIKTNPITRRAGYVIETKEKRNYGAASKLYPCNPRLDFEEASVIL
jgi:hypothetical protein